MYDVIIIGAFRRVIARMDNSAVCLGSTAADILLFLQHAALYAPTGGIVCPFNLNIAMAENANANGVEFHFDTEVTDLRPVEDGCEIRTSKGTYKTRYVVNAAGVYADKFHNMVSNKKIHITPRRGDYCLLDKTAGNHVSHTVFALPGKYGKGVPALREKSPPSKRMPLCGYPVRLSHLMP